MRPRNIDEFVGQEHIVGPGRLLRRAIQADRLSSVIFWGPPGTGKTTLARIIANSTKAHFTALNAVLAGVADIRAAVAAAEKRRGDMFGRRTLLFVDEVHRFNKAQQDALLPWVENGTITLIGATTENPFFEVNKALVSRSRIFQLEPLEGRHLRAVAEMALADAERGYGGTAVHVEPAALDHLVDVANGDARALLNAIELAVETTLPSASAAGEPIVIDLAVAEESIQRRAVLYDKEGDSHYDTVSAFIKSVRGSDPDAALYWLARMIYAGEDPRFILRRMFILAAEDVGLAEPAAVNVVASCAAAFEWVGMPEGQFHLSQAALYLATAPKSNTTLGFFDALAAVRQERTGDVPDALKDGNRDSAALGHGQDYRYPHAFRDHWIAQQYLPAALRGRIFYRPSDQGHEGRLRVLVERRREAQLAAMSEAERGDGAGTTWSGPLVKGVAERDRWLTRAAGAASRRLAHLRDTLFEVAALERSDRVLVALATDGLLVWEAMRLTPEGGVWAHVEDDGAASDLRHSAAAMRDVGGDLADETLSVVVGPLTSLPDLLAEIGGAGEGPRFEAVVGRDVLGKLPDAAARARALGAIVTLIAPGGRLVLSETVPAASSRPSDLLGDTAASGLRERVAAAEAAWLDSDARLGWTPHDLLAQCRSAGLVAVSAHEVVSGERLELSTDLVARWLQEGPLHDALSATLTGADLETARRELGRLVGGRAVPWRLVNVVLAGRIPGDGQ